MSSLGDFTRHLPTTDSGRIVQHASEKDDVTFGRTVCSKNSCCFAAGCSGGHYVVNDQDGLTGKSMTGAHSKRVSLILKTLFDRDAFLWSSVSATA